MEEVKKKKEDIAWHDALSLTFPLLLYIIPSFLMSLCGKLSNFPSHRRDIFTSRRRVTHLVVSIRDYVLVSLYIVPSHAYVRVISCRVLFLFSYGLYFLDRRVIDVAEAWMSSSRYLNLTGTYRLRGLWKELWYRWLSPVGENCSINRGLQYSRNLLASFSRITLLNDQQKRLVHQTGYFFNNWIYSLIPCIKLAGLKKSLEKKTKRLVIF